jgi:hypothetical protein
MTLESWNSGMYTATRASARLGVFRDSRLARLGDSADPGLKGKAVTRRVTETSESQESESQMDREGQSKNRDSGKERRIE